MSQVTFEYRKTIHPHHKDRPLLGGYATEPPRRLSQFPNLQLEE
jgi:hypothetical protein